MALRAARPHVPVVRRGELTDALVAGGVVPDRGLDPQNHPGDDEDDRSKLDLPSRGEQVQQQQNPGHQQGEVACGTHRRGGGSHTAL